MGVSDTEDRDKHNKTSLKEERVIDTEDRDKNNETGLQEGGGIEMSTTSASIYAMHALFALYLLT